MLKNLINKLFLLPRPLKQFFVLFYELSSLTIAFSLATLLNYENLNINIQENYIIFIFSTIFFIFSFSILGFYRQVFRYTNFIFFLIKIIIISFIHIIFLLAILKFFNENINYSKLILFVLFFYNLILIGRFLLTSLSLIYNGKSNQSFINVLIYNIDQTSVDLSQYLKKNSNYRVVGFLVNQKSVFLKQVNDLPIFDYMDLPRINNKLQITNIFFNDFSKVPNNILDNLNNLDLNLIKIPSFENAIKNNNLNVKKIEVADLLDRNIYKDKTLVNEIKNKKILITGAGGSIGSELTKQVLFSEPSSLTIIDSSEFNLFKITQEIKELKSKNNLNIKICPILDNLMDENLINNLFSENLPQIVFHCAAYKHVHIAEENIIQFVKNNIFVTDLISRISIKHKTEKFVLISTDKAVKPLNIMGATKRIAEKIILSKKTLDNCHTDFSVVRFGNVLNSSGSVVPIFKEQINKGGPVTVTDKNATRYMMLIEEAVYLVLQTLKNKGDIFILNMSNPIKIYDLAKKMIFMHGKKIKTGDFSENSIEIHITGLRKGEKVHEELLIGNNVTVSSNKNIFISSENHPENEHIINLIKSLKTSVLNYNLKNIKKILFDNVER